VFIASSVYVFYSSLAYVRVGAMIGVAVMLAGVLLLFVLRTFGGRKRAAA
jgi:hypothetical protein